MVFRAYARRDGALVLVPDCLIASRDAEARHGPLAFVGRIDHEQQPGAAIWARVLDDIDRQSYAVVRSSAQAMLAAAIAAEAA